MQLEEIQNGEKGRRREERPTRETKRGAVGVRGRENVVGRFWWAPEISAYLRPTQPQSVEPRFLLFYDLFFMILFFPSSARPSGTLSTEGLEIDSDVRCNPICLHDTAKPFFLPR